MRGRQTKSEQAAIWTPPPSWTEVSNGIWHPPDYKPTRWEFPAPVVRNADDATREVARCLGSLKYFALTYCWTIDEDDPEGTSIRKLPGYPYLRTFFERMQTPQNTHIDKSRQMMLTWSMMIVILWDILFHHHWSDLVISKRAKDVDDGGADSTVNSSLGKLRFVHSNLPEFLWQPFQYKKFSVRHAAHESMVQGETGKGSAASRGQTHKRGVADEAAYIERGESVFKGLRQAAKTGTTLISTPNGKAGMFARIKFSNTTTFQKMSFHWTEHPRKSIGLYCPCGWKAQPQQGTTAIQQFRTHDCPLLASREFAHRPQPRSPWYDQQCNDMRPEDVASELDISYERSQRGRVYYQFDQSRHVKPVLEALGPRLLAETETEYRLRYLRFVLNPHLQTVVCWDFGISDPTVMLLAQILSEDPLRVRFVDEVEETERSYDFYETIVKTLWRRALTEIGAKSELHYGDPAAKQRDSKLESWWTNLAHAGIPIVRDGYGEMMEWIDFIGEMYRHDQIEITDWCTKLIDSTESYHYPLDKDGIPIPGDHKPVHDEYSHTMDAKRYLFRNRYKDRLLNRGKRGVRTRRILARGRVDPGSESRIF